MTIKRITPLENRSSTLSDIVDKVNELILSFNELLKNLKPGWQTGENKGYENEVIDRYRIEEPK